MKYSQSRLEGVSGGLPGHEMPSHRGLPRLAVSRESSDAQGTSIGPISQDDHPDVGQLALGFGNPPSSANPRRASGVRGQISKLADDKRDGGAASPEMRLDGEEAPISYERYVQIATLRAGRGLSFAELEFGWSLLFVFISNAGGKSLADPISRCSRSLRFEF